MRYARPDRALKLWWVWVITSLEVRRALNAEHSGLRLYCEPDHDLNVVGTSFEQIVRAAELIRQTAPWLEHRLDMYLPRFLVKSNRGSCDYRWFASLCVLDIDVTRNYPLEWIASVIVHEAAHSRLRRWGTYRANRQRRERACLRVQLRFLCELKRRGHSVDWWLDQVKERIHSPYAAGK